MQNLTAVLSGNKNKKQSTGELSEFVKSLSEYSSKWQRMSHALSAARIIFDIREDRGLKEIPIQEITLSLVETKLNLADVKAKISSLITT